MRFRDGSTLTSTVKSDPTTSGIKVLAATAAALRHEQLQASAAGCDQVCTKPIDPRKLAVQVRQLIGPAV